MILAGDVGGTKCNLALYEAQGGKLLRVVEERFESKNYREFEDILREFLQKTTEVRGAAPIAAAGFGVAGPVLNQQVKATNLPWLVDAASLARLLGTARVLLLNDLQASASSLDLLEPVELCVLNQGTSVAGGAKVVIAAGTGLGEAILFWDGKRYVVAPTEGGHAAFAPRTEREIELLRYAKTQEPYVDCETLLSGRGFRLIHEFLAPGVVHPSFREPDADPAPEITRRALERSCRTCVEALDIWTTLYGAEAANLALKALATAGVYVAGGIAIKILPKMQDGTFVRAFCEHPKFRTLLAQIPIYVVLNESAPMLGAAARAAALLSA